MKLDLFRKPVPTFRDHALLLLFPEAERRRRRRAADHAGQAELDLAERGCGDAADRKRADTDLAPGREVAFVARPLALELLDRGELLAMTPPHVDSLDHMHEVL